MSVSSLADLKFDKVAQVLRSCDYLSVLTIDKLFRKIMLDDFLMVGIYRLTWPGRRVPKEHGESSIYA